METPLVIVFVLYYCINFKFILMISISINITIIVTTANVLY
jgi:hypothetical protein